MASAVSRPSYGRPMSWLEQTLAYREVPYESLFPSIRLG